jgi:hypothetical protein
MLVPHRFLHRVEAMPVEAAPCQVLLQLESLSLGARPPMLEAVCGCAFFAFGSALLLAHSAQVHDFSHEQTPVT